MFLKIKEHNLISRLDLCAECKIRIRNSSLERSAKENEGVLPFVIIFHTKFCVCHSYFPLCTLAKRKTKGHHGASYSSLAVTTVGLASDELELFPDSATYWIITSIFLSISSGH